MATSSCKGGGNIVLGRWLCAKFKLKGKMGQMDTGGQLTVGTTVCPLGPPSFHTDSSFCTLNAFTRFAWTQPRRPFQAPCPATSGLRGDETSSPRGQTRPLVDRESINYKSRRPAVCKPLGSSGGRLDCWKSLPLQEGGTDRAEWRVQDDDQAWLGRRRPSVWSRGGTPCPPSLCPLSSLGAPGFPAVLPRPPLGVGTAEYPTPGSRSAFGTHFRLCPHSGVSGDFFTGTSKKQDGFGSQACGLFGNTAPSKT